MHGHPEPYNALCMSTYVCALHVWTYMNVLIVIQLAAEDDFYSGAHHAPHSRFQSPAHLFSLVAAGPQCHKALWGSCLFFSLLLGCRAVSCNKSLPQSQGRGSRRIRVVYVGRVECCHEVELEMRFWCLKYNVIASQPRGMFRWKVAKNTFLFLTLYCCISYSIRAFATFTVGKITNLCKGLGSPFN
jgi:hypothetical protein